MRRVTMKPLKPRKQLDDELDLCTSSIGLPEQGPQATWLDYRNGSWKSQVKGSVKWVPEEAVILGLQMAGFSRCLRTAFPACICAFILLGHLPYWIRLALRAPFYFKAPPPNTVLF